MKLGLDGGGTELERLRRRNAELESEIERLRSGRARSEAAHGNELLRVNIELTAAQHALTDNGAREGLILESATGYAILTTDLDGRVTAWNEGARILLGWDEAEALGEDARMIFTPEDRVAGAPEEEMAGAVAEGRAEDERWHIRKDASRFWASGLMMPLKGPDGTQTGFLKILRDRTAELNAADNQLRRLEQMKALAEASRTIIGTTDLATTLQAITDAARGIIGAHQSVCSLTRGPEWSQAINAVGLSDKYDGWKDYATMPDGAGIYAWLCEGNRTVRMTQGQLEAHPRWRGFGDHAGEHPPMRGWLATALVGSDGTNLGLIQLSDKVEGDFDEADEAILVQLAQFAASAIERAQVQDQLKESEARFRNMADHAPVMMWVTDPDGRCTYLNRRWFEFTGQTPEEAEGVGWLDAAHPDDAERAGETFLAANATREPFRLEYRLRRADGTYRWAIDAASPRFAEDGSFLGYVGSVIDIDERREAEEAQRRSEARLQVERDLLATLIRQAPLGIAIAEAPSGRALVLNDKAVELLGHGQRGEDARRYERYGAVHPDGRPYAVGDYPTMRAITRGEVVEQEEMLYRRPGPRGPESRRLSVSSAPVRDESGSIVAVVTLFIDIEEQRRAEERERESEARLADERARLAALVDNLPVGVCFIDPEGKALLTNPAFRRFLPGGEMPSRMADGAERWIAWDETGERLPRDRYPGARALRGETVPGVEFLHRASDGREIWTRVSGVPLHDAGGALSAALVVIVDIDGEKRAQEALRLLNETLEAQVAERTAERDRTWNNSRDLLLVLGTDGVYRAVHPAWTEILGWRTDELVGRNHLDFIHPDEHAASRGALAKAAKERLPPFENRHLHKDGSYRWISWVAAPEGGLIYASGRDVTAEKEQADALRQTADALRQSQKMEAVGQLTGGIAHDFNNLLAGIVGSLDLMQTRIRQGRTTEIERYVTAAMSSAQRAAALTHRLLAFSRRQPLDPKPVDANALVAGMEDLLRRTIGRSIHLEMVLAGGLWRTLCDPVQLESALLNLSINARDAMPEGGKLTVETGNAHLDEAYAAATRDVTPGQYVCVCVTDSGAGMPPEVIARAFDPFFTTKPIGQGTGLGLSMVYGFAKQSEGHVRIYSEPGQGTTVKIYLPRHRGATGEEGAPAAQAEAPRAEAGETVLVVEDEPVIRDLVVEVLQDLGYSVLEASDGPSGLRLLDTRQRIDLLITDMGLPGITGRQLADQARERRPGLKVLFITGFAENATLASGFLEPGMQMVTKPFAIDALAAKIRLMIEGH